MKAFSFISAVALGSSLAAQIPTISSGSYLQNFGTADVSSWTDNSTFPGWYSTDAIGHLNITSTTSSASNTGGFYSYECNGNNDQKIGSRASGGTGTIRYGVVLRNTTGSAIRSFNVRYTGYQLSLGSNGNAVNTIAVDYIISTAVPTINGTATGSAAGLNFAQVQNSATTGGTMLAAYPCTQSRSINACFAVNLPNNSYIMLRWTDVDDSNNDHHMAIDDVEIAFDLTGTVCNVLLPVELLSFDAVLNGKEETELSWSSASERNNDFYSVERSANGIDFETIETVKGAGNSTALLNYSSKDLQPFEGVSYYRLKQTDFDGSYSYSAMVSIDRSVRASRLAVWPNPTEDGMIRIAAGNAAVAVEVFDHTGRLLLAGTNAEPIDVSVFGKGMYLVRVSSGDKSITRKVIYH